MRACHRGKSEARGTCSAKGAPCEDQLVVHVRSSALTEEHAHTRTHAHTPVYMRIYHNYSSSEFRVYYHVDTYGARYLRVAY